MRCQRCGGTPRNPADPEECLCPEGFLLVKNVVLHVCWCGARFPNVQEWMIHRIHAIMRYVRSDVGWGLGIDTLVDVLSRHDGFKLVIKT